MDDLDHSMHIANDDWTVFYEESEECGQLQPLLACHDSPNLSDSEDSANSSSVFGTGQQEPQQSTAAKYDLTTQAEICLDYPEGTINTAEHLTEETKANITTTLQTEQLNVQSSDGESTELNKEDGEEQMESHIHELKSIQSPDPLSFNQTELNVNELHSTDRVRSEDVSGVALRAEKERWFVTVNDNAARQRVRAPSVKKKRRQKKTRKDNHMCRPGQERSLENGVKLEIMKDSNDFEGGTDTEYVTQADQNLVNKSRGYSSAEADPESVHMDVISDSSQMSLTSSEEDNLSEKLVMSHSPRDISTEPAIDAKPHNRFTPKYPSRLDSVESDELDDGVEFFSTHSFDSESYLSATESVEELQHLLVDHQQLQSSLSLTENSHLFNLTENTDADNMQDRDSCDSPLCCVVTATDCEGHESTNVQPSAGQSANKMPDDNATCDNDTRSTLPSDTPGLQKHEMNLSASGCSSGQQLLPIPDLIVTPCHVVDSPETYAEAAGHTRPVYAISAFWDEMEKLTINDILQLRMGGSTSPRETQETVTPDIDDHSSLVDTIEYNSSDGGLMDTSDTADSDYSTQPDESKPDCSSCEFFNSDFEEEYCQFLGASRNPSPDPQSKNQQSKSDSLYSLAHEEEESTGSDGKETPVPSEDFERKCFDDQDSNALISSELALPRRITKSKSMHNVQALNTEDLSLQLLIGHDESSPFLSSCSSLEENVVLKASDSLGTRIPFLEEHDQISFPGVFEYFFREDKTQSDSRCVTVYDPKDISVAPVFDFTLCASNKKSFSFLHDSPLSEEKLIPIFSCSRPIIRELTFPNPDYVFLSADYEEEDDISPIRVVSHAFIQGTDCGAAAPHGFNTWNSLRKIRFPGKGSIWCRRSGAWVFPGEAEKITIKSADPPITVLTVRRVSSTPSQVFSELAVQQRVLEVIQTTRQEGIFSTLKQSDMCLVCIAFASWVLKSSDPEAADAWKAALLANVSALSAIQYLRQYVKKKNPS